MLEYFRRGYRLLADNPEIYILLLLFYIIYLLTDQLIMVLPLSFIWFLIIFMFVLTYSFSVPILLVTKQSGKEITPKLLLTTFLIIFKRLLFPALLFFVLVFIAAIVLFILFHQFLPLRSSDLGSNLIKTSVGMFIFSFLVFWSFYFSLEGKGFLRSLIKSIKFSVKNFKFVFLIFIILDIVYILRFLIDGSDNFQSWNHVLKTFLMAPVLEAVSLWVSASALLFYQKASKNS